MADNMRRTLTKLYKLRSDKAITMADEIMNLLGWSIDDQLQFTINFADNSLTIVKASDQSNSGIQSE